MVKSVCVCGCVCVCVCVCVLSCCVPRFTRTAGKSEEYKSLKTRTERQEYKKKWQQELFASTSKNTTKKEQRDTNTSEAAMRGEYVTFDMLIQKFGGTARAESGAMNYASWCRTQPPAAKGRPWYKYNIASRMDEYLYVKECHDDSQVSTRSITDTQEARKGMGMGQQGFLGSKPNVGGEQQDPDLSRPRNNAVTQRVSIYL